MQLLKLNTRNDAVKMLQELLNEAGYDLQATGYFGMDTDKDVRGFQLKNNLVVDGVVYTKTWTTLVNKVPVDLSDMQSKFLQESDIVNLANQLQLEPAVIKAVNSVESSGRGFFIDGRPKILFEGQIFWRQLQQRGYDPAVMQPGFENVLYPVWTKKFYYGDKREWDRLAKAISISPKADVAEAAYASASYGLFQIMGFHFQALGYSEILGFVTDMKENEGKQLDVFGKFLVINNLVSYLKNHDWSGFAKRYNGAGYVANKYDTRLEAAYELFSK
ncbi:MAG: N-acetylmuramidase domain-containing protein [Chitinophagaceae bacterium]